MNQSGLKESSAEHITSQPSILLCSTSLVEEKIQAIDRLENDESDDAIDQLKKALELYAVKTPPEITPSQPDQLKKIRIGGLSARASRALIRNKNPNGVRHICGLAVSKDHDPAIRECAAFALAGVVNPAAIDALAKALDDEDLGVRYNAALSLKESLQVLHANSPKTFGLARRFAERAIDALAALAVYKDRAGDPNEDPSAYLARDLVRRYMTPSAEKIILDVIANSLDAVITCRAIQILSEFINSDSARLFSDMLLDRNRDAAEYRLIGQVLQGWCDAYVLESAAIITDENDFLLNVMNFFSSARRLAYQERREAAHAILVNTPMLSQGSKQSTRP